MLALLVAAMAVGVIRYPFSSREKAPATEKTAPVEGAAQPPPPAMLRVAERDQQALRSVIEPVSPKRSGPPEERNPAPAVLTQDIGREDLNYEERLLRVRSLPTSLAAAEIGVLLDLLADPAAPKGLRPALSHALENEILNKLGAQEQFPAPLIPLLLQMAQDPRQSSVMRDYALQHLHAIWNRASEAERQEIDLFFHSMLDETGESLAGTALVALRDSAGQDPQKRREVGRKALALARDEQNGELTRISALNVCARFRVEEAQPLALALAREAPTMSIRIAAIAALGDLPMNGEAERELARILEKGHPRLHAAAHAALARGGVSPASTLEK